MNNHSFHLEVYKQAGFFSLPIMIVVLLVTTIVGGGGYTVYKVNQMEQRNAEVVADLQAKLEQVATTSQEDVVGLPISIEQATATDLAITETESKADQAQSYESVQVNVPSAVSQITVVDICSNLADVQSVVPDGYKQSGSTCIKREDKCKNVEGIQDTVPANMIISKEYGCITEADLDAIEAKIASAEKAKRDAQNTSKQCEDAKSELEKAEKEYNKYQKILDDSYGREMTQEVREASILAVSAVNKVSIAKSKVSASCNNVYIPATTVNYGDLMPKGPTYTNCRYDGSGYIYCTSY